ncbi:MAG: hypothetical protein R3236_06315, partial [Phycisphaeraceae bacterium]|nr:hypothetical protein [Phycisphaeraceae bacterium]
ISPAQFVALGRKVFADVREKAREDAPTENGIEYHPGRPQPHLVLAIESAKGSKTKLPDPSAVAEVNTKDGGPADEAGADDAEADKTKQSGLKWFGSGDAKKPTKADRASGKEEKPASGTEKQPATENDEGSDAGADKDPAPAKPSSAGLKWFKSKKASQPKSPATDDK